MKHLSNEELRTLVKETAGQVLVNNMQVAQQDLQAAIEDQSNQDALVSALAAILVEAQNNCADTIIQVLEKLMY